MVKAASGHLESEKGEAEAERNCLRSLACLLKAEAKKGTLNLKKVQTLLAGDRMLQAVWDRVDAE